MRRVRPRIGCHRGGLRWGTSCVLIAAIKGSCGYAQIYSTSLFGNQPVYRLRQELFGHLQRLLLSFHSHNRSRELLTKVTSDTKALKELSASAVVDFPAPADLWAGIIRSGPLRPRKRQDTRRGPDHRTGNPR